MKNEKDMSATLTIDLKRTRIRLHKDTWQKMGKPEYIQFLINPEEMYLAILGTDKPIKGGTANHVHFATKMGKGVNSEYHSAYLINLLADKIGNLDFRFSYHLTGEVDEQNRVAYYSFQTLKKNERELNSDGKRLLHPKH